MALLLCCAPSCVFLAAAVRSEPTTGESPVAQLIADLGSEQYTQREKAQQELQRLGLEAFDALLEAQHHDDIEIASRARYLLRSISIPWTTDADDADVKSLLRRYDEGGQEERQNRIEQLAALDNSRGVAALCRVMRFETSETLSKQAALSVLNHAMPPDEARRKALAEAIRSTVGTSGRSAAKWLLTYARTLLDAPSTLNEWREIAAAEAEVLARFPQETDRRLVRDLLRWEAELLLRLKRESDAGLVLRQVIDLTQEDRLELFDLLDWALEREVWFVADEMAARFPARFQEDPLLLYRWAESQRKNGKTELAEETAKRGLAIEPERSERHIETARRLIDRLLYDWAERELRQVAAAAKANSEVGLEARFYLSDLLFDLERELASADILREAVEAVGQDEKLLQNFNRSQDRLRALMHYRYAVHYGKLGDRQQQRTQLEEAVRHDPADLDTLIAMYRLPDADAQWRQKTQERIDSVAGRLTDLARQYEEMVEKPANSRLRLEVLAPLADLHNQYAWLVSNTRGDLREALRASRRSLELSPDNSAYLDTLGRCYYALGDLENAIRFQSRAVQLEPSSQQIRRQLEFFRSELVRAAKAPTPPAQD